jgi:Chaperone of endosialidase
VGEEALRHNVSGHDNVAVGRSALFSNTTGSTNIALGENAGGNLINTSGNIDIGHSGVVGDSFTMRLGGGLNRTFISGVRGVTTGNNDAINVMIDSFGQLGTISSSRRFKHDIKPMDTVSESVLALNPVTFHYKNDSTNRPEFGLIAEEVAEVNPSLVVHDDKGEIYTVRYEAINAMLLNEFLKAHRTLQGQREEIDGLKRELKEQRALIEKVNARVDKAALPLVVDKL